MVWKQEHPLSSSSVLVGMVALAQGMLCIQMDYHWHMHLWIEVTVGTFHLDTLCLGVYSSGTACSKLGLKFKLCGLASFIIPNLQEANLLYYW